MARLGYRRKSRRLWWVVGVIGVLSIAASFGTPKAGCAGSPDDEDDEATSEDQTSGLEGLERPPPARAGYTPTRLDAIASSTFCPTEGRVASVGARGLRVNAGGMRGVGAEDASRSVELAFRFRGESKEAVPLANGEMRKQIGIKLRAHDTCNVVYVMWHIAPTPGVWILVKSNPGMSTHAECRDRGYINVDSTVAVPEIRVNEPHTLRADIDGETLWLHADGVEIWKGALPKEAFAFDGPVGTRTDNGEFDFELRVPGGLQRAARCASGGVE